MESLISLFKALLEMFQEKPRKTLSAKEAKSQFESKKPRKIEVTDFTLSEFACKCGKCENKVDIELLEKLQKLRDLYGSPIYINSGYRCPDHNAAVGGVENSQHVQGRAADIRGDDLDRLYDQAKKVFMAIGDGKKRGFLHVDLRLGKVRRWDY